MKAFLVIILMFASVVCMTECRNNKNAVSNIAEPKNRAAEELDIREAVFRYQFNKNASGAQKDADSYYIDIIQNGKGIDPDDSFMKRFAENHPPVKKGSECETSVEKGVIDKKSGRHGLLFNVGGIQWTSDRQVEVSGGYYEGNLSASGNIYQLEKKNGKWIVIKDRMEWIS